MKMFILQPIKPTFIIFFLSKDFSDFEWNTLYDGNTIFCQQKYTIRKGFKTGLL